MFLVVPPQQWMSQYNKSAILRVPILTIVYGMGCVSCETTTQPNFRLMVNKHGNGKPFTDDFLTWNLHVENISQPAGRPCVNCEYRLADYWHVQIPRSPRQGMYARERAKEIPQRHPSLRDLHKCQCHLHKYTSATASPIWEKNVEVREINVYVRICQYM